MKPFPLSELIRLVGDENIQMQNLDDATTSISTTAQGSKAQFVTPIRADLNGFEKLGLILWIDRDKAAAALETYRKEGN